MHKAFGLFLLTVIVLSSSCQKSREAAKLNQYIVEGMVLYRNHCSNCHQIDGSGFKQLYPPLRDSDYLQKTKPEAWVCMIKYGIKNPMVVNGITYTQPMPGNEKLTALEIAEIVTYVENTWGKGRGILEVKEVEKLLMSCP